MGDARNNPTPTSVIQAGTAAALSRFQCSFPAICTTPESADNRVTVQPAIRIASKRGQQTDPKPVTIPVKWLSWGPFVIQGKLTVGDEVMVECRDKNWNAWLEEGGVVDDTQEGGHQSGYAHACPVMTSNAQRPGVNPAGVGLRIGRKDSLTTVEIRSDGSIKLAATDVTLTTGAGLARFLTSLHATISGWAPTPGDGGLALKTALLLDWLLLTPPTGGPPPP